MHTCKPGPKPEVIILYFAYTYEHVDWSRYDFRL